VFPRQAAHSRICLADFYRPLSSGERDVAPIQAVTAGPRVTELMARLEQEGEFSEQLYVHGLGVQVAEGSAEWLHAEIRKALGIGPAQGRRYSWGYPACPDQSEHEKVFRLLDAPQIGLSLSGGYAVEPEQSTLAIVAHHPQAIYFGMKSGKLSDKPSPDQIIADPEGRSGHRIVDGEVVFGDAPSDEEPPEEGDMEAMDTRPAPQPSG
jgi:5-methyltetrahydrofolate--homocysteine methyltransferase